MFRGQADSSDHSTEMTSAGPASQGIAWHALPEFEVLEKWETSPAGLSDPAAAERQQEFGRNLLPARRAPTPAVILLHQFMNPLIYILLAAGVVALLMGDVTDAGFIFGVVFLNASLGAFQEWKAERSAASLQHLLKAMAHVRRNGVVVELNAEEVVPGDLVYLESGARVPADLRLIGVNNLTVDEALLTGESLPVEKQLAALAEDIPLGDRRNMAFAGSTVAAGRGYGIVVGTGMSTEVGKLARSVMTTETAKPPLVIRMEKLSRQISLAVLVACGLLGAVAFSRGTPVLDVFFMAVALAVSAIPEGLPVAMTVALSIATHRMARRNVIVRKLTAVEGLGSCTYIATDKTGTLTLNRQTVMSIWLARGAQVTCDLEGVRTPAGSEESLRNFIRSSVVCNEATAHRQGDKWVFSGDAVDTAFWHLAIQAGIDPYEIPGRDHPAWEIPFESDRAYAARFFVERGQVRVAVKGAPEVLIDRCRSMQGAAGEEPLDMERVDAELARLTDTGHRVLAIAEGIVDTTLGTESLDDRDLPPLVLLGLAGLIDPARPEVKKAVAQCQQAGVEVAMVTGDHPRTALAIAREVGIADSDEQVVTGAQLAEIGSPNVSQFLETVRTARVFARVSPLQKLQIVESLVKLGYFVAVTGDGVNDAPALKRAHIGVAMGSGTDVTKDTASIIVADDNFASIEAGIEEGRFAYDNIRKVTYLLISTGAAELVLFLLSLLSGLPLPLLPVQLLWLNLATNGIQDVALAFERGEAGAATRPPRRPGEGIFNRLMIEETVISGAAIGLVTYISFYVLLAQMGLSEFDTRNRILLLMVLLENFRVFNCRSEHVSAFRVPLRRNWILVGGVAVANGVHMLAMHLPVAQAVLRVAPIPVHEWAEALLFAASVLAVMELFKLLKFGRAMYIGENAAVQGG